MLKYKIIVNPMSGRGVRGQSIPLIEQHLRDLGLNFDIAITEYPWHAMHLAQQAVEEQYDVVVAAGGDGTANEVLNGLMLAKQALVGPVEVPPVGQVTAPAVGQLPFPVALGILCVGRGNDLAYGMNVPAGVEEGCRVLAQNHRQTVDVGRVEGGLYPQGRYFGNGVGIGFDAVVGFVAVKMKRLTGFPSYIIAALKTTFLYYKAPLVRVEFNGHDQELLALMVSVMNGRRLGGRFHITPQASPGDGLFDLCIARQTSRLRIFNLLIKVIQARHTDQPEFQMARARQVKVTALQGVLPAHADGETLCTDARQLLLELLPRQLEIVCQPDL